MLFFNTQSETLSRVEQMTTIQLENLEQSLPVGSDEIIAVLEELIKRSKEAQPIVALATPEEDRHITLEEGIKWLTGLGCTELTILGDYLIKGRLDDGHAFSTDIREHNAVDIWRDRMLAKYADEEAQDQPSSDPIVVVPSFEEGQSKLVRADFAKLYPLSAGDALIQWSNGAMGYGWYLTTQPIDARRNPVTLFWDNGKFIPSSRFEQIAYIPAGVNYFPTPTQVSELGEQWEYWSNRRYLAELCGDADDEEFCSLFVLTVEALLFV